MACELRGLAPERFADVDALLAAGAIRMTVGSVGEGDRAIRSLLEAPAIAYVDIHNEGWGCFLARAERRDDV